MRRALLLALVAAAVAVEAFQFRLPVARPTSIGASRSSSPIARKQTWGIAPRGGVRRFAAPPPDGGFEGAVQPQREPEEDQLVSSSASSGAAALEEEGTQLRRGLGDLFQLWKRRLWYVLSACSESSHQQQLKPLTHVSTHPRDTTPGPRPTSSTRTPSRARPSWGSGHSTSSTSWATSSSTTRRWHRRSTAWWAGCPWPSCGQAW